MMRNQFLLVSLTYFSEQRKSFPCLSDIYLPISVFSSVDGCKNYQNLTDGTRKYDYKKPNSECDSTLKLGWYRFQGAAGTKMVTKCPPVDRCDASFPVWLSDDHPTVAEGAVQRKVCIHRFGDCCAESFNIQVNNCGSYYTYKLHSPGFCDARFCSAD